MNNISIQYFKTSYGELMLGSFNDGLCLCDWRYRKMRAAIDKRIQSGLDAVYEEEESKLILEVQDQLNAYFVGDLKIFDLPLEMVGSDFQKTVWQELMKIPFGNTDTYLGLSKRISTEKAIRAVAAANGANAISIIVPCHRIVGTDGSLVGYAGGLDAKRKLLQLEGSGSGQMRMFD